MRHVKQFNKCVLDELLYLHVYFPQIFEVCFYVWCVFNRSQFVNSILSSAFDVIYVKEQIFDMVVSYNTLFCTNTEIELMKVAFSF